MNIQEQIWEWYNCSGIEEKQKVIDSIGEVFDDLKRDFADRCSQCGEVMEDCDCKNSLT